MEKKKLNVLLIVLAVCIVVIATVLGGRLLGKESTSGNTKKENANNTTSGSSTIIEPVTEIEIPDDGMYSVEVKTEGDMFFAEIGVYVYTDNTLEELVWFDKTDENGIAEFTADDATGYVVVLQGIPEGYDIQEYYYITGAKTEIVLATALKEGVDLSEISYSLGDVIHDFSVTTPEGDTYTVSEILKEKKAIILNFWYVQCGPCKEEFPFINEAYAEYKDKIEILAMNPVNLDDEEIAAYKKSIGVDFPMMQCEEEWATALGITAYPTTVVIDRYGVISLIHTGSLPDAEIFSQLFEFFSSDDYKQTVVEDIFDIVTTELSQGTMDNPFELGGVLDFEITIRPNQVIYFNMFRVDKMNVRIEDADAYAIYEEKTYYPNNGVVGFKVFCPDTYTPAFVGIGNSGTEKKTFHVTLGADAGTYENPYVLKMGEFTASVSAGNDQGVFYEYRAEKTGALILQCLSGSKGVKYSYYLQNMRTSENRNLEYDSKTDADGKVTVALNVQKGDRVLICISTLPDSSGNYPSGTFKMKASMGNSLAKDKQYYGVSVVDDTLKPIVGATVKLSCLEIEPIEGVDDSQDENAMTVGKDISVVSDNKGLASSRIRLGAYKATVTVPTGYETTTTECILTKDNPNATFMLDRIIVEMKNYTVKVVDEDNKPIKGATINVKGIKVVSTNSQGNATIELPKGDYEITVGATGYAGKTAKILSDESMLTVVLEKKQEAIETEEYSVVVKFVGTVPKGFSEDIKIHFLYDGVPDGTTATVKIAEGISEAIAKVQLAKKTYTVELEFEDGSALRAYTSDLTLAATTKSLVIEVGNAIDASSDSGCELIYIKTLDEERAAYYVNEGTNPIINMDVNEYTYFMFTPERDGIYEISSNNASAKISYWVGNYGAGFWLDENTDCTSNSFFLTISNVGPSYIVALRGSKTGAVVIERIADAEKPIEPTDYVLKTPVKSGTYTGGSKTYFDKTASSDTYKLVYNSVDGYYHVGTSDGPIVYVDLNNATLSLSDLVANTAFRHYEYQDGKLVKIWNYTDCIVKFVEATKTGFYPMTEDLKTIIQLGGGDKGWWDKESLGYLFGEETVNPDVAWLFFCCY